MYPSSFALLEHDHALPASPSVAPNGRRERRTGFRELLSALVPRPRSARHRTVSPGYQPCE